MSFRVVESMITTLGRWQCDGVLPRLDFGSDPPTISTSYFGRRRLGSGWSTFTA